MNTILNYTLAVVVTILCLYCIELYLLLVEDTRVSDRYLISRKLDNSLPLYSPWELWQTKNTFMQTDDGKIFPIGAISKQKTVYCNEADDWLVYESDRYGFNNDPALIDDVVKRRRKLDTLFIGDSFVQGACVPQKDNFNGVLLNEGIIAAGMGIGGNGPMMYLASIKEYAQVLRPKNIVFMYYEGNDLPQIRAEKTSPLSLYLNEGHKVNLIDKQEIINNRLKQEIILNYQRLDIKLDREEKSEEKSVVEFVKLSKLRGRLSLLYAVDDRLCEWDMNDYKESGEMGWLVDTITESKKYAEKTNSKFYFVYLKSINSLLKKCNYGRSELIERLKMLDVNVIDTTNLFYDGEKRFDMFSMGRRGGHYSRLGYQIIGLHIKNTIEH